MYLCFAPMDWITNCATRLITKNIFEKYWNKEDSLEDEEDFTQILDNEYTLEQIRLAILELDEISKEVISLKFVEEKSYGEISQILWISQDLVRQRCSRALKALMIKLWQDSDK